MEGKREGSPSLKAKNTNNSFLLPPIQKGCAWDPDIALTFECAKCPGLKFPGSLLKQHKEHHGRVNHLLRLRVDETRRGKAMPHYFKTGEPLLLSKVGGDVQGKRKTLCNEPFVVTLKYYEGMKYTIGNKFLSRQKQGGNVEFVYFNLYHDDDEENTKSNKRTRRGGPMKKKKKKKEEENYFRLECQDGGIWVYCNVAEEVKSRTVVFVNGVTLGFGTYGSQTAESSQQRMKLNFGDVITISDGIEQKQGSFCDFLLKASAQTKKVKGTDMDDDGRQMPIGKTSQITETMTEHSHAALHNAVIVNNILHFLPTSVVKDLRFVTRLWNDEALRVLKNRVVLSPFQTYPTNQGLTQVSDYVYSKVNELKFPHMKIRLRLDNAFHKPREVEKQQLVKKMVDDIEWFFNPEFNSPQNLTILDLSGGSGSEATFKLFEMGLRSLTKSCTTLALNIEGFQNQSSPCLGKLRLTGLKHLSLTPPEDDDEAAFFRNFIAAFIPEVPNLSRLTLNLLGMEACQTIVLEEVAKIHDEKKFTNLTELIIHTDDFDEFPFSRLRPISSLRQDSLRILQITGLQPSTDSDNAMISHLHSALEGHKDSLEELSLEFEMYNIASTFTINFPKRMPKLKSLSIFLQFDDNPYLWAGTVVDMVWITFGGDVHDPDHNNEKLDYRRCFSSLSKLVILPTNQYHSSTDDPVPVVSWISVLPFLTPFVQPLTDENGSIIPMPSLQSVDIPFLLDGRYHHILDDLETTFPNANFPSDLVTARESPAFVEI